ncbi:MAG: protoheme IX farnesyltransferase [Planctomycetes bacterium]|nr:protoheme IX farnesyltransferase [Planctomycetota bacterium]
MRPAAQTTASEVGLLADLADLFKVRIASFVGLSAFVGGILVPGGRAWPSLEAALWITLSAGAASAFNQVLERDTDRRMLRTQDRPIPAGRIGARDALLVAALLAAVAVGMLAWRFTLLSALLTLATLFAYVAVYTPLKRASTLNTVVGALPGAAPPLLGYAAIAGEVGGWGWALFAVIFVWQFPHFMAIAWIHREDYARAGLRMLPSEPGAEGLAGRTAVVHAALLLFVTIVPALFGVAGLLFTAGATLLGLAYLAASARFAWKPERGSARLLLFTSLAYLPLLLVLAVVDPVAGALAAFR